jgi:iron complex outermembrane receptor protein
MKKLFVGCALAALATSNAYAQSTGSVDFGGPQEIVVTGGRTNGVGGVQTPDAAKTRQVLTSDFIQHQTPGQTINDTINMMPGVSFQNNDGFGASGGTLSIRGFDSSRISQTFDGIPLNDTGNYALYSNQQLDPELIEQVNVSLGSTDVDSPTASATGSTVNYRTRNPTEDFHVRIQGTAGGASIGDSNFFRVFGVVDSGVFTPFGTRAFISASNTSYRSPFNNVSSLRKTQVNGKIYQPIGSNGDFVSVAGHYNENRNNFFASVPLRSDTTASAFSTAPRIVGSGSGNRFPLAKGERYYTIADCTVPTAVGGSRQAAGTCGTAFDQRYNPSDTGNIRINSRFTLADGLVLTVDPSYQYTKANGGGTQTAEEGFCVPGGTATARSCATSTSGGSVGYVVTSNTSTTGTFYAGRDLNGDGDLLDAVTIVAPSQTQTKRYGVIAGLRYDISPNHTVRINYTLDYGRHRQTGESGFLNSSGGTVAFPVDNPIIGGGGVVLQKRDRLSKAILNQVAGEYRGQFFDKLTITAGLRAPFFKRDLNNNCFTVNTGGGVTCFTGVATANSGYGTAYPTLQAPQRRVLKYNKPLYNSFFYPRSSSAAKPKPETTDNIDLGLRYRSSKIQAQLAGWYTQFKNRLGSQFDPIENVTTYRNLGDVEKYGIDGSIAYRPVNVVTLYAFGSYLKSKIKDNVAYGLTSTYNCSNAVITNATDAANCAFTKGKRESGAPVYTLGGRAELNLGWFQIGAQAKRTGRRYVNDQNLPVVQCFTSTGSSSFTGGVGCAAANRLVQVYGAKVKGYTTVDLDARVSLEKVGLNDRTYFQFNVTNLFDKLYVGGFNGTLSTTGVTFAQIGAPRTVTGTLVVGF